MPRSLDDLLNQADDLAARFEAYEPTAGDLGTVDPVTALRLAALRRAEAERELAYVVERARKQSLAWQQIGAAIGTTGEAARQKYTRVSEGRLGRHIQERKGRRVTESSAEPRVRQPAPPSA